MKKAMELAHVIVEPLRMKILLALKEGPKYISQIAAATKSDRSSVSYHLGVLEQYELINSEYKILVEPRSKGKAARVYSLDSERLEHALGEVDKLLPKLKLK